MSPPWSLVKTFLVVKLAQVAIVYHTPPPFDTSSQLLLANYTSEKAAFIEALPGPSWCHTIAQSLVTNVLDKLVAWDNVYFADLFVNDIRYEHQFVFCPLWWRLIRAIPTGPTFYDKLAVAVLVANISHLAAAIVLYYLTLATFRSYKFFGSSSIAHLSSTLFVLSPAGIFLTTSYSESISALLSFVALYLREVAINHEDFTSRVHGSIRYHAVYVFSGVFAALAFGQRANCLLLGIAYLYDLYEYGYRAKNLHDAITSVAAGSILFAAFVFSNVYNYLVFCTSHSTQKWCSNTIPSLFLYAQGHYWDNGFLKYWTVGNIPNFAFAAPTLLVLFLSYRTFITEFPAKNVLPILQINGAFMVGVIFFWNTQIATRISTFLPLFYWTLAALLLSPHHKQLARAVVGYMIGWVVLQTSMFAAFLPPA